MRYWVPREVDHLLHPFTVPFGIVLGEQDVQPQAYMLFKINVHEQEIKYPGYKRYKKRDS
jgi:hypothetical protein